MLKYYKILLQGIVIIKKNKTVVFFLLLFGIAYYYNYHEILFYKPQSVHAWRQADDASIALNYYQHGMNFFKPELHVLRSDNYTSGCAAGEAPILYFFVAVLYNLFGYHDFWFRFTNFICFTFGLYMLFRLIYLLTNNFFWSLSLTFLFFASPIIIYYGNNFLPNSTALSFVFAGWFYYFLHKNYEKEKHNNLSAFFFTLSGLLKITSLINVFVLIFIHVFNKKSLLKGKIKKIAPFIICVLVVGLWYIYAFYYNSIHHSDYFLNKIIPVWELSFEKIESIINYFIATWLGQFFSFYDYYFFILCLLIIFKHYRLIDKSLKQLLILITISGLIYCSLWFSQFHDHDYYLLEIVIIFVFICMIAIKSLLTKYYKICNSIAIKILFTIFLLYNIVYAKNLINYRYATVNGCNDYHKYKSLSEISEYLRSIHIESDDKIISIPEPANCYTLYLMNQKGWGLFHENHKDSIEIENYIKKGAKYLIINGIDYIKPSYLQKFMCKKSGQFKDVYIYKLN